MLAANISGMRLLSRRKRKKGDVCMYVNVRKGKNDIKYKKEE
jgi:hypothetical protein